MLRGSQAAAVTAAPALPDVTAACWTLTCLPADIHSRLPIAASRACIPAVSALHDVAAAGAVADVGAAVAATARGAAAAGAAAATAGAAAALALRHAGWAAHRQGWLGPSGLTVAAARHLQSTEVKSASAFSWQSLSQKRLTWAHQPPGQVQAGQLSAAGSSCRCQTFHACTASLHTRMGALQSLALGSCSKPHGHSKRQACQGAA